MPSPTPIIAPSNRATLKPLTQFYSKARATNLQKNPKISLI